MKTKVIVKTNLGGELKYVIWDGQYYPAGEVEIIEQLPVIEIGVIDEQAKRSKG